MACFSRNQTNGASGSSWAESASRAAISSDLAKGNVGSAAGIANRLDMSLESRKEALIDFILSNPRVRLEEQLGRVIETGMLPYSEVVPTVTDAYERAVMRGSTGEYSVASNIVRFGRSNQIQGQLKLQDIDRKVFEALLGKRDLRTEDFRALVWTSRRLLETDQMVRERIPENFERRLRARNVEGIGMWLNYLPEHRDGMDMAALNAAVYAWHRGDRQYATQLVIMFNWGPTRIPWLMKEMLGKRPETENDLEALFAKAEDVMQRQSPSLRR